MGTPGWEGNSGKSGLNHVTLESSPSLSEKRGGQGGELPLDILKRRSSKGDLLQ